MSKTCYIESKMYGLKENQVSADMVLHCYKQSPVMNCVIKNFGTSPSIHSFCAFLSRLV